MRRAPLTPFLHTVFRVHKFQQKIGFDVIPVPAKEYNCGIQDDMEVLHAKMLEADGILLAAPVYIATVPGQVKTFINRCGIFVHDYRPRGLGSSRMTIGKISFTQSST